MGSSLVVKELLTLNSNVFTSAIAKMVIRTAVFVAYFLQKLIASYPIFGIASLHNLGILQNTGQYIL